MGIFGDLWEWWFLLFGGIKKSWQIIVACLWYKKIKTTCSQILHTLDILTGATKCMNKNDFQMKAFYMLLYKETVLYSTEQVVKYHHLKWLKN